MKNTSRKPVTIYDIAKKANVTAATVSLVLNEKGFISEETRNRIKKIAKDLDYSPNQIARMLKNQKTKQIMLSLADMRNDFYYDVIQSVNKTVIQYDYTLLLNYNEMNKDIELKMLEYLKENHVDGLIMISIFLNRTLINTINSIKKPIVFSTITAGIPEEYKIKCDFVGVNTEEAMYLSVKHLIEMGHRKIAYIGLHVESPTGFERFEGYKRALADYKIKLNWNDVYLGGYTMDFSYAKVCELVKKELPTAICTTSDVLAVGVYKALKRFSLNIPEDISVIGIDNSDICEILSPSLSSVSIKPNNLGETAAELLIQRLAKPQKKIERVIFKPTIYLRESTVEI